MRPGNVPGTWPKDDDVAIPDALKPVIPPGVKNCA